MAARAGEGLACDSSVRTIERVASKETLVSSTIVTGNIIIKPDMAFYPVGVWAERLAGRPKRCHSGAIGSA